MVIWTIFAILCTVAVGVTVGLLIVNCIDKKKKRLRLSVTLSLLSIALCIASFLTLYHGSRDHIGDGKVVAYIYSQSEDNRYPVYYSEKHDEYFIIETNLYNAIDLADKVVIRKEIAEKYIEAYENLHSINLKGSG